MEKLRKKKVFSKKSHKSAKKAFFSHKTKNRNKLSQVSIIFCINLQKLNFCKQKQI